MIVHPTRTFDRQAAAEYALRYWDDPNPAFANMDQRGAGGDCTNFTSQALLAAGFAMDYRETGYYKEWWYRRIGREAYDANQDDWWSCTWSLPENQFHYLGRNYGAIYDVKRNRDAIRNLELGDIFYYDWDGDGRFNHSSIVTGFDRFGRPLITYRTLRPRTPVRNQHWELLFRGNAARIFAIHLTDNPAPFRAVPNWNRLRPCESARA